MNDKVTYTVIDAVGKQYQVNIPVLIAVCKGFYFIEGTDEYYIYECDKVKLLAISN